MQLSKILNRDANNLDIFRVIAACIVIYAHAFSLAPQPGAGDYLGRLLGFDYSGSLAVKMFFFLSGLVVTNSLLEKRDPVKFVISRVFRIWPALVFMLLVSALIIGPLATNLSLEDYFNNGAVYRYVYTNASMFPAYELPGVFVNNPYKLVVNGSIRTIQYEVAAYIVLLGAFLVGIFKSRYVPALAFLLIALDPLFGNKLLFTWMPQNHEINLLLPCFAFGAVLAFYKQYINIDIMVVAGCWILYWVFRNGSHNFYFFYAAFFLTILYVSALPLMLKMKLNTDTSYGIYLWGFPVQQIMADNFLGYGLVFNQVASIFICLFAGYLSWHLIEKHAIALGATLGRQLTSKRALRASASAPLVM